MKTRCEHCGYYGGTHETQCPDSEATMRRAEKDCGALLAQRNALAEQVAALRETMVLYLSNFLAGQRGLSAQVTTQDSGRAKLMADEILAIHKPDRKEVEG